MNLKVYWGMCACGGGCRLHFATLHLSNNTNTNHMECGVHFLAVMAKGQIVGLSWLANTLCPKTGTLE